MHMEEEAPNPEAGIGFTTGELIEAFKDYLDPEDDIPFMEEMEPDEAQEYLLSALLARDVEDPDALFTDKGFGVLSEKPADEITMMNRPALEGKPYTTEEADRRVADRDKDL